MEKNELLRSLGIDFDKDDKNNYEAAKMIYSLYENAVKVGFSEERAFEIVKLMITISIKR